MVKFFVLFFDKRYARGCKCYMKYGVICCLRQRDILIRFLTRAAQKLVPRQGDQHAAKHECRPGKNEV